MRQEIKALHFRGMIRWENLPVFGVSQALGIIKFRQPAEFHVHVVQRLVEDVLRSCR